MAAAWESAPIVEDEAPPTRGGGLKRSAWESAPAVTPTVESALPNVAPGGLTPPGRRGAAAVPTAQEAAGGGYVAPQPTAAAAREQQRVSGLAANPIKDRVIGAVEAGIEMLTQLVASPAGMVGGVVSGEGSQAMTGPTMQRAAAGVRRGLEFNPLFGPGIATLRAMGGGTGEAMTPQGQAYTEDIGAVTEALPPFLGHIGPVQGMTAGLARPGAAADATGGLRRSVGMITDAVRRTPIEEPPAASVGARGVDMATQRRERAAGLPVPVKLTKGDAERTFEQQRFEKEAAKNPEVGAPLRARKADQREAILKNFDDFVDQTGAADTDLNAVGKAVTDPIYEKAAKAKQEIRAAYDKADEAGETAELVNYTPVRAYIEDQTPTTREKLAPILKMAEEQLAKNDPEGSGQISIKALNDVRAAIRANTEFGTPNSVQGAEIIKRIDAATENAGGDLYKAARKLHQTYAAEFKNQGVIRDLINLKKGTTDRKVALADVFQRSVLGAKLEEVRAVKRTLTSAGDAGVQAWNDLRGRTIEWIREEATKSATRDERGNPVISADKLGKAVDKLDKDGRLDELFGKQGAQQLRDVSDIARDIWTSPPDAVNTSNTASVLIGAVDTLITYMASGGTVPLPAFTLLKKGMQNLKERKLKAKVRYALGPDEPIQGSPTRAFTPPPTPQGGTPPPTPPSPKKPPPDERIPVGQAKELREIPTLPVERIRGKIPVGQAIELPAETGRAPDIKPLPVGKTREMSLADAPRETKRERELLTLRDQVTDPEIRKDIDGEIAAERQRATDAARADEYRRIAATTGDAGLRARFTAKAEKLAPTTKSSEPPPKLDMPAALPSWREFVAERMGPYMKSEGGHAGAMKRISEEWKTAKQQQPEPIPVGEATELEVQDATLDMVKATAQAEADWRREHRLGDMDAERAKTTARALQYDAAAVERAAQQFENSPRAFDREVQRVIDEGEARANQGEQGAGGGQRLGRPAEAAGNAAGARPEPAGPDRAAASGAQRAQPAGEGRSTAARLKEAEQAGSDAQRLPDLNGLVIADDGQINLGGSAEFIRQFMRYVVSPSEQNQLMTSDGRLNQRGAARIRNAIFSRAYNDVDTVAMMTESTDANVRNVLAGMLRAAPEVAHLRDLMDAGARSGRDFAPDLVEAVRRFSDAREQGMKVEQALAQGSLIGGEARPEVAALMRALEADSRAPKRIAEMIRGLVQEIDSGGDPRQGSLMEPGARYDLQNREQEE